MIFPPAPPPPPRAVLVVVDGLRPADAGWLFHDGAAAWMNVRTAGAGGGYATLGAGTRLRGPEPAVGPHLHVDMRRLAAANRGLSYRVDLGAMGSAVHRAGECTAAFGGPGAAVAVADAQGRVDQGNLQPARPAELAATHCSLVAFEVPERSARAFLRRLPARPGELLIALGVGGGQLLPAMVRGDGPGLATSATTRQPGLIADTDVAPSVLAFLGLGGDPGFVGHPLRVVSGPAAAALRLGAVERANDLRRPWVFRGYIYLESLLVLLATAAILRRRDGTRLRLAVRWMAAVPAGFLAVALVPRAGPALAGAVTLAAAIALAWVCRDLLGLALATVGLLLLDVVRGSPWMIASPLGFSFAAGARYYGIGDEYEGLLVGAAVVAAGLAYDRLGGHGRAAILAGLGGVALLLGWPGLGTNFGGLLSCGVGAIALWAGLRRLGWGTLAGAGLVLVALLAGSGIYDAWRAGSAATHLGRAAELVGRSGPAALLPIAARKLAMNERLILTTPWSWVLFVSIGCYAVLVHRHGGVYGRATAGRPGAAAALTAVTAATLANLIGQDAGVVAAALDMVFGSALLLELLLAQTGRGAPVARPGPANAGQESQAAGRILGTLHPAPAPRPAAGPAPARKPTVKEDDR